MKTLCIDIGGTGIKTIVLDARSKPVSDRARALTPEPATPGAVLRVACDLAKRQPDFDRVSVGFPGVVRKGVIFTAANLHPRWVGLNLARELQKRLHKPVRVSNDADVQGLGAIKGRGVEMVITLGTGMGSALFVEGMMVPNIELGHHPFRHDKSYEDLLGKKGLKKLGRKKWNKRLRQAIATMDALFNYDRLYIGGGNASKIEGELPPRTNVIPNIAGLLGGVKLWDQPAKLHPAKLHPAKLRPISSE
jgi:polyphosphate glucokinase